MLFSIDIVFIGSDLKVVDVARNVAPGYVVTERTPVRYFLEVNANEASAISKGDQVGITLYQAQAAPINLSSVVPFAATLMVLGFFSSWIGGTMRTVAAPAREKPVLYGTEGKRLLPQTVSHKELAVKILAGLRGKGEPYRAYVRYPKDRSAFATVGAIVGGHYSWNPAGFTVWVDAWERNPEWPQDHLLGIRELRQPRSFEATEEGVTKALEYVETEFPTFTESTWVSKSIPVYVAQELGILKLGRLPQTARKFISNWFDKGVEAGKTDGWMDVENTLKETAQTYPEIRDAHELVWTDIELWEQTDHFNMLYGSKMWEDAVTEARGDREKASDIYADLKSEFWEGYLAGRKEIGRDIYQLAGELMKSPSTEFLPQAVSKRGEVLYQINLGAPEHVEEVALENGTAVLKRYSKPVVRFKPTEEQRRRIATGKGYLHIFSKQVVERLDYPLEAKRGRLTGDFIIRRDRIGNIIITYTVDIGKSVFLQTEADKKLAYDILTKEEREELDEGWRVEIRDDEPRASILEELWEAKAGAELLPEARYRGLAVMPNLPDEAYKDILFVEYVRDLVRLGEVISEEEAKRMWQGWKRRHSAGERKPAVIPTEPRRRRPQKEELEFLPDSPEVLAQTIDAIGYREKIDNAFQEAIKRAKGLK
jgi:hypothetical protein